MTALELLNEAKKAAEKRQKAYDNALKVFGNPKKNEADRLKAIDSIPNSDALKSGIRNVREFIKGQIDMVQNGNYSVDAAKNVINNHINGETSTVDEEVKPFADILAKSAEERLNEIANDREQEAERKKAEAEEQAKKLKDACNLSTTTTRIATKEDILKARRDMFLQNM